MSLLIRAARQRMEMEDYAGYDDMGDPGIGSILKGAARFIGKAGKKLGGIIPVIGTAVAVGGAAYGLLKKKPKLLGPGVGRQPVLLGGGLGGFESFAEPQELPMPGSGVQVQLPRGPFGIGGGGFQVGSFPQPGRQPVGQPGQPMGTQMCVGASGVMRFKPTHLNKSGYFTYQQGRAARPITWVAPGTKCVAKRRMNALNPRALSKAVRRVMSAKRASKLIQRVSVRSSCPTRRAPSGKSCKAKR